MWKIIILLILFFVLIFKLKTKTIESYVGNLRVADDLDNKRALKYALQQFCNNKGYYWYQGASEFVFDCKHSKETCVRDSVYPTPENKDAAPSYYEWRDASTQDAIDAGYNGVRDSQTKLLSSQANLSSNVINENDIINEKTGGVCIMGNEPFRKLCESEKLKYDPFTGKCKTTREYCLTKALPFCNGDCYDDPFSATMTAVFGTTVGRSVGSITNLTVTNAACAIDDAIKKEK
jgi:hypothetical protein